MSASLPQRGPAPRTAGRELDLSIIEQVMGAKWFPTPNDMTYREALWLMFPSQEFPTEGAGWIYAYRYADGSPDVIKSNLPAYSSEIASAFQVVAWMKANAPTRYKNLSLVAYCYNRTYATFDSQAFGEYDAETWAEANGEHATPLAICLAALKAVEAFGAVTPSPGAQDQ